MSTMPWTIPIAVLITIAATRGPVGGTLAGVAFFESVRRAYTPAATRSLTMADFPVVERTIELEPPAKPVEPPAKPVEPPAKPGELVAVLNEPPAKPGEPALTEAEWRLRVLSAREALERDQVLADGMQSRVNALTTDSLNRDDPAQRAELLNQRTRALAELDRLIKQIESDKRAILAIEEDARKKNIPPGWIR